MEFKKKAEDEGCAKSGIKQSTIEADLTKLEVYMIEYDAEKGECLSADETLKKARKYVGQSKYNVFVNNDEHFAIYCKTGKAAKLFILDPKEFNTKNILGKSLSSKIVSSLAQQTGQIVLVSTAKSIATRFPRAAISAALPVAAEAAGTFIGVGVEGATMVRLRNHFSISNAIFLHPKQLHSIISGLRHLQEAKREQGRQTE